MSMRTTAGLLYWFAKETNLLTTVTTSGTMQSDEIWVDVTLTGNVYVPTGITLTLCGGTINLNGYFIKRTGGNIEIENGATLTGVKAYEKNGNTIIGYYPSLGAAVSYASNNSKVEMLAGTYNGNITIYNKNVSIEGQGAGSSYINGNITLNNADGSTIYDLRTKRISTSNTMTHIQNVECKELSFYGDNVGVNYSTIDGDDQYVNNITNTDGVMIDNTFENMIDGLFVMGSASYNTIINDFCNNESDISAYSGAYVNSSYNKYSYNRNYSCDGNVNFSGPNTICSSSNLSKTNGGKDGNVFDDGKAKDDFAIVDAKYMDLLKTLSDEREEKGVVDVKEFKDAYEDSNSESKLKPI